MVNIQSTTLSFNQSKLKVETKPLNYYNYKYLEFIAVDDSSKNEFDGTSEVLTDIIDDLSLGYFNLVVIHQESKLMSLVFEDELRVYRICFTSGYPNCPPSIFASNDESSCRLVEAPLEWRNDESLATVTTEYICSTIKILKEQMSA